jgi:hypothetical protein
MTSYAPGTVLRIKGPDGSERLAIQRSNGNVLEVHGTERTTFSNVKEWEAARGGSAVTEEEMRIVNKDTRGFLYDWDHTNHSRFTNWLFEMISEFAPALLDREDVRDAFNHLVGVFKKYPAELFVWHMKMGKKHRYCGWRYDVEYVPRYNLPFHLNGVGVDAWVSIHTAWSPLHALIEPVRAALQKKRDLAILERNIKLRQERVWKAENRVAYQQRSLELEKKDLAALESKKAALMA